MHGTEFTSRMEHVYEILLNFILHCRKPKYRFVKPNTPGIHEKKENLEDFVKLKSFLVEKENCKNGEILEDSGGSNK